MMPLPKFLKMHLMVCSLIKKLLPRFCFDMLCQEPSLPRVLQTLLPPEVPSPCLLRQMMPLPKFLKRRSMVCSLIKKLLPRFCFDMLCQEPSLPRDCNTQPLTQRGELPRTK